MRKSTLLAFTALSLGACDLAPEFKLPQVLTPNAYKEDTATETVTVEPVTDGKWKRFDDKAQIEEFAWWRMFKMPELDALMEQAMKDNPSLEASAQRVLSARAVSDSAEAKLYPTVDLGFGPERQRQSPAAQEPNLPPGTSPSVKPYTLYTAKGTIGYELDLFGRNRGLMREAISKADAQADNYRAARLALQTDLAQTYFRVAALRQEYALIGKNLKSREDTLKLTREKFNVGEVDSLQVSSAEADIALVKSDAASIAQSLSAAEHALAILVGKPPSEISAGIKELKGAPPVIPAGLPSSLLERRPDIQAAADTIAAANQRIGIARTGYFPDISISAVGGFVSGDLGDLFKWSNRTWLIGPLAGTVVSQPIFEGGRIAAVKAQSQADYAAAVADYRVAVLNAFREVEDSLSGIRNAGEQVKATNGGVNAARSANKVAKERYDVGYSSHLEYLDAQRTLLAAERTNVQALGNQYINTVQLVKALGGSWQSPTKPETTGDTPLPKGAAPATAPAPVIKEEAPKPVAVEEPTAADEPMFIERWWDDITASDAPTPAPVATPASDLPPAELPPTEPAKAEEPADAASDEPTLVEQWWNDLTE